MQLGMQLRFQEWATRVFGVEGTVPAEAQRSVAASVVDALEESADDFLRVAGAVERCAAIAASALVNTAPELDEARLRDVYSREIWMGITEISAFARAGFELSR